MYMRTLCIFALMVCLASSSCSALDLSGRNTTEELQRSKASIAQLNEQMAAVNKELASLKSEVQKMKGADAVTKDSSVTGEMGKKEQVNEVDISKRDEMKKPTDEKQSMEGTEASLKDLKVKVLSGNGKLPTAKQMSKRLVVMGYRVADIGIAVRADYKVNTIYYAPDYRAEAQRLAVQLGGKTIAKPLTWTSFFHIIVVAAP